MLTNAVWSYLQTSMMYHPLFSQTVSSKMVLYNLMLNLSEHSEATSQQIIQGIYTGEESLSQSAMEEGEVVRQMEQTIQ